MTTNNGPRYVYAPGSDEHSAAWDGDEEPAPEPDAAFPVVLCPRCTDETACDDHEARP